MSRQPSRRPGRWRAVVTRKLGACPRCMRASLGLAIAAWSCYGLARAVGAPTLVHGATLSAAGAFTLLFLAHIGAFFLRAARHWRAGTFAVGPAGDGGHSESHSRRRFIVTSAAVLGGALLAPLFRLFSAPVLAQGSPPVPCECGAPDPKEPKVACPSCRCQTKGEPKRPPVKDCNANRNGATTQTSADGTCAGSLKPCGGECTRTFTWTCTPGNKKEKGFHWELTKEDDNCPTTGAPPNQATTSTGKCRGKGCKVPSETCGKQTVWTCDPHAGEGKDPKGRWTPVGPTVDNPACTT